MRQGANMGLLRVDHPDIEAFVHAKDGLRKVGNFNISVGVTDDFMRSVQADGEFALRLPGTHSVARTLRARALLDQIVDCAWRTG
ncbi:hypothetical protein, partial [Salmonella enterica]|uniref:hypothetical protein n=1 Tax=Salmonella enterica TaxID=28901 RepID=UPI003D2E42C3